MENIELNIYSNNLPSLESGSYKVTVSQNVSVGDRNEETYQNTTNYQVESSGFDIDSKIEQIFPANGSTGLYNIFIPHIIFSTKSLPWEKGKTPWLSLLTFHNGEDFAFKLDSEIDSNQLNNYNSKVFNEFKNTKFTLLELPFQLFKNISPTIDELVYLAHVRETTLCTSQSSQFLQNKSLLSTENNAPASSVILSNRLPGKGLNTMVLISVNGLNENIEIKDEEKIQLIVLKKWSFENNTVDESFSTYLEKHVDANDFKLDSKTIQNQDFKNLIDAGYVPLKNNAKTNNAEFYKGPLTPIFLEKKVDNPTEDKEHPAYQLGRLLCLQNKNIAEAIFNSRIENIRNASLQNEINQQETSLNKTTSSQVNATLKKEKTSKELHLNRLTDLLKTFNSSKTL